MEDDTRYNRTQNYGEVQFYLTWYEPNLEECRFLLLKVIEQAVRDYLSSANAIFDSEIQQWQEAKDFIYDDEYRLMWGDLELSTKDILDILDLDIEYFRETASRRFKERYGESDA